ncbi:MAG: helix-turn-helix transcriptional regulator [Coriobacteriaceae bacterium]|nr:helix-turn-helix transcriptional regulator [Coriobacteriaceae bacterium]
MIRGKVFDRYRTYGMVCALYLSCPYHLFNGYTGPLFDRRAIFAVIGLLVGCFAYRLYLDERGDQSSSDPSPSKFIEALILILTVFSIGIELADLPFYFAGDVESESLAFLSPALSGLISTYILKFEPVVIFLGAALASFAFFRAHDLDEVAVKKNCVCSGLPSRNSLVAIPLLLGCTGAATRLVWSIFETPAYGSPVSPKVVMSGLIALALCVLLAFVFLLVERGAHYLLLNIAQDKRFARIGFVQLLFVSMCSGYLACIIAIRYAYVPSIGIAFTPILIAFVLASSVFIFRHAEMPPHSVEDAENAVDGLTKLLSEQHGLSQRESLFASYVLLGKTGKEIASCCEVAPGTVRSTLYRAYKKLDVHGEDELRSLLKRDTDVSEYLNQGSFGSEKLDRSELVDDKDECSAIARARLAGSVGSVLIMGACVSILFPLKVAGSSWGVSHLPLVGVSLAFVTIGLSGVARRSFVQIGLGAHLRPATPAANRLEMIFGFVWSFIVFLSAAFCLSYVSHGKLMQLFGSYSPTMAIVSYAALSVQLLTHIDSLIGEWNRASALQIAVSMVLGMFLSYAGGNALVLGVILCALFLMSYSRRPQRVNEGDRSECSGGDTGERGYGEGLLCALLALCFEEWWRSLGQPSYMLSIVPLLVSLLVAYVFASRRWFYPHYSFMDAVCDCLLAVLITVVGGGSMVSLLLSSIFLFCSMLGNAGLGPAMRTSLFFAGAAIVGSLLVVNKLQDIAAVPSLLIIELLGSGHGFLIAVGAIISVICTLAGPLLWRVARIGWMNHEAYSCSCELDGESGALPRRQKALLVSRGLSDLQAEILLLTAQGATAQAISDTVFYAPATVKALRTASYRQLRIRDRAQLISLLSQVKDV